MKVRCSLIVLLAAALAPSLAAATIVNGGFESPVCSVPGGVCSVTPTGWALIKGNVEIVTSDYWEVSEGSNSVDLDGSSVGGISQDIATVLGFSYQVFFDLAGNPYPFPTIKQLRVSAAGIYQDYTFDVTNTSAIDMGWVPRTFDFTATSTTTTLMFESMDTTGGNAGPALDNVSISDLSGVPEPATGALAGLALAVLLWTRRR